MLLEATTIHYDIIKVHNYILIKHIEEDLAHQPLKSLWGVGEPKGHHYPLKEIISGQECTTMLVLRGDPNLMVPHGWVYLRKIACCKQIIKQVLDTQ